MHSVTSSELDDLAVVGEVRVDRGSG